MTITTLLSILLLFHLNSSLVFAEEIVVQAEQASQSAGNEEEPAKLENLQELVTASVSFSKEQRLIYSKSVDYTVSVTNNSTQNVFVVGIVPSYPSRSKITLPGSRNIRPVGAGNKEEISGSFTCELDVSKVDFAIHVLIHNSADQANPFRIEAFSGSLPVHRPGNNWLDFQSIGIYAMLAVLGYFSYIWFGSKLTGTATSSGRAHRERRAKERKASAPSASQSPDTEWIPRHHFQTGQQKLRTNAATSSTSEVVSTSSDSSLTSDDEKKVTRKQK